MLTNDTRITEPEYWNRIYSGANMNAKVDSSNTVRPPSTFDRFRWVADQAEGPNVLGIASGHAHIEKRIKAANSEWAVYASDQAEAAKAVARYTPYYLIDAYKIPFGDKVFNTVICCQALEYMEDQHAFLKEARRVGYKLIITVPIGEMEKWSQLRIYTEESVKGMLISYGNIEVFDRQGDLLLVKLNFFD